MTTKLRISALAFSLLASGASFAAPNNTTGTAQGCVWSDFVGGAPEPAGYGPAIDITYPNTGEAVTGRVYVQQASYGGLWVGDSMVGSVLKIELYVDNSLVATMDLTGRKLNPLVWNAGRAAKGTHELKLRSYSANDDRTKTCYVDSTPEYPVVQ